MVYYATVQTLSWTVYSSKTREGGGGPGTSLVFDEWFDPLHFRLFVSVLTGMSSSGRQPSSRLQRRNPSRPQT